VKNVWVGLSRRLPSGAYEWSDQNLQPSYASRSSGYKTSLFIAAAAAAAAATTTTTTTTHSTTTTYYVV